jgi:hypothetical protein
VKHNSTKHLVKQASKKQSQISDVLCMSLLQPIPASQAASFAVIANYYDCTTQFSSIAEREWMGGWCSEAGERFLGTCCTVTEWVAT